MTLAVGDTRPQSGTPTPPRELTGAAGNVLDALAHLTGGRAAVPLTVKTVADRTGVTERTVRRALLVLKAAGLVDVQETRGSLSKFTVSPSNRCES